jgi:two-component system cell cycle sensor histidine kinase/response regulator CckA
MSGVGRILLVEDEDHVRSIAASSLQSLGYQVTEAADGEEALEYLEANPGSIDLMISDVVLPGIDGPGVLAQGKAYLGEAKVIFISGYAERDFARTLDEEREVLFLPKPFTLKQLAEMVKKALAGKQSLAA